MGSERGEMFIFYLGGRMGEEMEYLKELYLCGEGKLEGLMRWDMGEEME